RYLFGSRYFVNSTTWVFLNTRNRLELLSRSDPVYSLNASDADARQKTSSVKKLLQIAVPLSPMPFSRTVPPTNHEISMLLNRFSAMAVAIHLDPTFPNVRFRIDQAQLANVLMDDYSKAEAALLNGVRSP
ncbi:hypothetical protein EDD16DRAFT_1570827, partial [Pisolithus croceorrhizus]